MIDWEKIAKQNSLTPKEFTKEILTVAACVGVMELDSKVGGHIDDAMKFTCSDEIGEIEVYIKRK